MVETWTLEKIREREATVAIIGLGYVGLPLALAFVRAGFSVIGFDVDPDYVQELQKGASRIIDVPSGQLRQALASGRFQPYHDATALASADVYLICVPTPLSKTRQPDLTYVDQAIRTLARYWHPPAMVVLESTTYPGTTDEILLPLLTAAGAQLDRDFLLAFSPERVDPGNMLFPFETIPKVVGGVSQASTRVTAALYATVFQHVHAVSSARTAELAKLLENTFRNVNIALANEFAQICEALAIDIWEVIEAAKTKPFGFMAFHPGPGIGGHCIPLDPQYLVYKARLSGFEPRLVALADQINQSMPKFVVQQAWRLLNEQGKPLKGARVLIVGVAYKAGVPDTRESPAFPVIEELERFGASIAYFDPYVPRLNVNSTLQLSSVPLTEQLLDDVDLAVILTDHLTPEYALLAAVPGKVLDTRNALRGYTAKRQAPAIL